MAELPWSGCESLINPFLRQKHDDDWWLCSSSDCLYGNKVGKTLICESKQLLNFWYLVLQTDTPFCVFELTVVTSSSTLTPSTTPTLKIHHAKTVSVTIYPKALWILCLQFLNGGAIFKQPFDILIMIIMVLRLPFSLPYPVFYFLSSLPGGHRGWTCG